MRSGVLFLALSCSSVAIAGGYDTPMLYAGEHMGMGGAAVAGVKDPSAMFHNPAGLAQVKKGSALLHVTYLRGTVTGSPSSTPEGTSITSEPTSAPFPLLGVAYRVHPKVVLGLGAFPIASAGATYVYEGAANRTTDATTLIFAEGGPSVALDLGAVRLGLSYRMTYMLLDRFSGGDGVDPLIDFELTGTDTNGFRAGLQADLLSNDTMKLEVGLNYRHQVIMNPTDPEGRALGFAVNDIASRFMLPSRLSGGLRFSTGPWAVAADIEYGFNSQNQKSTLGGDADIGGGNTQRVELDNIFGWQDALTYRLGVEHQLANGMKVRAGGAFDDTTSSKQYPTAFGTPPAPTILFGGGVGKKMGPWTIDLSMVHRSGETEVTADDLAQAEENCVFCSKKGTYAISLTGTYLSVGYDWN